MFPTSRVLITITLVLAFLLSSPKPHSEQGRPHSEQGQTTSPR